MDFNLTPDQRLFHSTTREFLNRSVPLGTIRERAGAVRGFERDWWLQGADLGWTAMLVPDDLGGGSVSGAPLSDLVIVAEEMGRACAPGPLFTVSAVLAGLTRAGEEFAPIVSAIGRGETIAAWAFYEPGHGVDPVTPGTIAEPDGDGYRLSGLKDRVESGDQADVFLVSAWSPDGPMQLLVPADAPGVRVAASWTLDLVRHTAQVEFNDVVVSADSVVHRGQEAAEAFEKQLQVAATLATAEIAGALDRAFELTTQWMADRYTFGRPLNSYQALKHRMADNKTWVEACHAAVSGAARALDEASDNAAEHVSAAKSYASAKAPAIVQDCVQLHGGLGVTWEHDIHLYLRRVTLDSALYGTAGEHRRRLADLLDRSAA